MGAFELQIFVSLVVVLGAAFVALICDYLKGNNEQLRETNIELRVRNDEREKWWMFRRTPVRNSQGARAVERPAVHAPVAAPQGMDPRIFLKPLATRPEAAAPVARPLVARPPVKAPEVTEHIPRELVELLQIAQGHPISPDQSLAQPPLEPVGLHSETPTVGLPPLAQMLDHAGEAAPAAEAAGSVPPMAGPAKLEWGFSLQDFFTVFRFPEAGQLLEAAEPLLPRYPLAAIAEAAVVWEAGRVAMASGGQAASLAALPCGGEDRCSAEAWETQVPRAELGFAGPAGLAWEAETEKMPAAVPPAPALAEVRSRLLEPRLATPEPALPWPSMQAGLLAGIAWEGGAVALPAIGMQAAPAAAFDAAGATPFAGGLLEMPRLTLQPAEPSGLVWEGVTVADRFGPVTGGVRKALAVEARVEMPAWQGMVPALILELQVEAEPAPEYEEEPEPVRDAVRIRVLSEEMVMPEREFAPRLEAVRAQEEEYFELPPIAATKEMAEIAAIPASPAEFVPFVPALEPIELTAGAPELMAAGLETVAEEFVEDPPIAPVAAPVEEPAVLPAPPRFTPLSPSIAAIAPERSEPEFTLETPWVETRGIVVEMPSPARPLDVEVAPLETEAKPTAHLAIPAGVFQSGALESLMVRPEPFTGLVLAIAILDRTVMGPDVTGEAMTELNRSIEEMLLSSLRDSDMLCRMGDDEFVMVHPGETGGPAQRRTAAMSERLWDFQLRSLGSYMVIFSLGSAESSAQPLSDAVENAREQMRQAARARRGAGTVSIAAGRRVVNA